METAEPAVVRAAAGQAISRREFGAIAASGLRGAIHAVVSRHVRRPELQLPRSLARRCDRRHAEARLAQLRAVAEPRRAAEDAARRTAALARDRLARHVPQVRDQFAKASIVLSAYNISIKDDFSDAEIERAFDMTTALGAPLITSSSNIATVARIAPAAERRKMVVAMHNHSRIDPNEFATAKSLTDAMAKSRYISDQSRHRPFHGDQRGRRRVPEAASRSHRHAALQGSQARSGSERRIRRRRYADCRGPEARARQQVADSAEHRIRIQGRRFGG